MPLLIADGIHSSNPSPHELDGFLPGSHVDLDRSYAGVAQYLLGREQVFVGGDLPSLTQRPALYSGANAERVQEIEETRWQMAMSPLPGDDATHTELVAEQVVLMAEDRIAEEVSRRRDLNLIRRLGISSRDLVRFSAWLDMEMRELEHEEPTIVLGPEAAMRPGAVEEQLVNDYSAAMAQESTLDDGWSKVAIALQEEIEVRRAAIGAVCAEIDLSDEKLARVVDRWSRDILSDVGRFALQS